MLNKNCFKVLRGLNLRLCHTFSKLSPDAQRAIWAYRIIQEIQEANEQTQYFEEVDGKKVIKPSLADVIKGLTFKNVKNLNYQFEDEYRDDVLKIFTTGVFLNYQVFGQQRIIQGAQTKIQQNPFLRPFVFYPNTLVTKYMFNTIIFQSIKRPMFLTFGNYGISKTVAIILLHHLSSIINKYFCKKKNLAQVKEFRQLLNKGLIAAIPKIFYYSSNSKLSQQQFVDIIKQQCTEIKLPNYDKQLSQDLDQQKQLKSQNEFQIIKATYHLRGIRVVVAFDQLNAIASVLRQYNTELSDRKLSKVDFQRLKKKLKQAKRQIQRIDTLKNLCDHLFFNSSADIELELLGKQGDQLPGDNVTLDLNGHSKIAYQQLPYNKYINTRWGQVSLTHCIWSQILKKLVSSSIQEHVIEQMKLMFYQTVDISGYIWPLYLRFLHIRQTIFPLNTTFQTPLFEQVNLGNFVEQLTQAISQMLIYSQKSFLIRILQLMKKGTKVDHSIKLQLVAILHKYANENKNQTKAPLEIPLADLQIEFKQSIKQFLKAKKLGIQLFSFYIDRMKQDRPVIFAFAPAQILKFSKYILCKFVDQNPQLIPEIKNIARWNPKAYGDLVQYYFLKTLMQRKANIWITFQTHEKSQTKDFTIVKPIKFLHFQVKNRKIWNNFYFILEAAYNQPGKYFTGVPTTIDKKYDTQQAETDNLSSTSPSFDAAIVMYIDNKFYIETFDFTINENVNNMKIRVADAASLLTKITRDQKQISLNTPFISTDEQINQNKTKTSRRKLKTAEQLFPDFTKLQKNKKFFVRHTIVCPNSVIQQMKIIQVDTEFLRFKNAHQGKAKDDLIKSEKQKAYKIKAKLLNKDVSQVTIQEQILKNYNKTEEQSDRNIYEGQEQNTNRRKTLKFRDDQIFSRWSISFCSLLEMKNSNEYNTNAKKLKQLLSIRFAQNEKN